MAKTRILVISDTHIPRAASDLPAEIYNEIKRVDMILHAGDIIEKSLLDKLSKLKKTYAVCGNMDSAELQHLLSQKEVVEVGGVRIGLIHGYGPPRDLPERIKGEFENVDAVVFGHSHEAMNVIEDNVLFFNPGSPTDKIFATGNSYGILEVDDKKIEGKIIKL